MLNLHLLSIRFIGTAILMAVERMTEAEHMDEQNVRRFVLILKGSPREKGNSAALADRVAAGAREAGAEVRSISLHSLDIRPCDACDLCREKGAGCVIDDDMQSLYPQLLAADAILIASPIYYFTISAQTKLCIDRWYALESPQTGNALRGKQFGIVLTYGDTDLYTSGGINAIHTFESIFRYIKAEIVGMVYGTASDPGDVEKQPALLEQAFQLGLRMGMKRGQA
jgi:multimeric flavodoxin WrbA